MPSRYAQDRPGNGRSAFSLVEILGVLAIVAVLAGLTFMMASSSIKTVDNIQLNVHAAHAGKKKSTARKTPDPSWAANEHIVIFKRGTANPQAEARRLAGLCSGQVLADYFGPFLGCAIRIADGQYAALVNDSVVASVEKNWRMHSCVETVPTGIRRLSTTLGPIGGGGGLSPRMRNVKQGAAGGNYAAVAVVDTGIDGTHPDLNVVFSIGFNNPNVGDQNGHGTHCAGIIAAIHNDIGVVGVAPGAPLWSVRVLDAQGVGTFADLISALQFLATNANNVGVISMSLGGPTSAAVNQAVANCVSKGQICVVAAGNSSADALTFSPASEASAICVAALADSDGLPGGVGPATPAGPDDTFATFSNWGSTVKVIAPGVDILSTVPGNAYGLKSGTSMACPHVAGLAVLARSSAHSQGIRNIRFNRGAPPTTSPTLSPVAFLQDLLQTSTENIAGIFDSRTYPLVTAKGF